MRRETADFIGSGLLLAALLVALLATLAPPAGASVPSTTVAAAPASIERGRALFYAKGCVSCHMKANEQRPIAAVGPDLTGLASRAADRKPGMSAEAYVHESLRTPSAFVVPGYGSATFGMPELHLSDDEIAALSAFLLGTP